VSEETEKLITTLPAYDSLPTRAKNALRDNEIETVAHLLSLDNKKIKKWDKVGATTGRQIRTFRDDTKFLSFGPSNAEDKKPEAKPKQRKSISVEHGNGFILFDEVIEEGPEDEMDLGFLALDLTMGRITQITQGMQKHTMIHYETELTETNYRILQEPAEVLKRIHEAKGKVHA
jgi:hypothetical protein